MSNLRDLPLYRTKAALLVMGMIASTTGELCVFGAAPAQASLIARHLPHHTREDARIGDWRLTVSRDPFSGAIACRLRSADKRVLYQAGAVGFRFKRKWGVENAVYRLDGGEPRHTRDDLPDLIARGTPVDHGPPGNSAEGIVWVPYELLTGANRIAIEPGRGHTPQTFHFRGLVALHDVALTRGCGPEDHFIE